jgi:YHS domain-containing protein
VPIWSAWLLIVAWKDAAARAVIRFFKSILGDHYQHVVHILKGAKISTEKDPVCGMSVTDPPAGGTVDYNGHTYAFCSSGCHAKFGANPKFYA